MVRKKNERGQDKKTVFRLEGKDVRPDKLARFEKALATIQGSSPQAGMCTPDYIRYGYDLLTPTFNDAPWP